MQLLRGGGAAARGMDSLTRRDGLVLHRPWLGVWKKEIMAYARGHKLTWREDATNADMHHRRNRVRRRLLPYLQRQFGRQVAENLFRAAEIARAESEWLDTLSLGAAREPELSVKALRALPLAQQRRTFLRWLQARGVADISFADVEAVRGLLEKTVPAKVNLSAGRFARRRAGRLFARRDDGARRARHRPLAGRQRGGLFRPLRVATALRAFAANSGAAGSWRRRRRH